MAIESRKKEGENPTAFLFRFSKRVRQSGVLLEARRRRFKSRNVNRTKRRSSAVYRAGKRAEMARMKRLGVQ